MDPRGGAGSLRIALGHRAVARKIHETVAVLSNASQEDEAVNRQRRRSSLEADTTFLEELNRPEEGQGPTAESAPAPQPTQPPLLAMVAPLSLSRGQSGDSVNSLATVVPEGTIPDSPMSADGKENLGFPADDDDLMSSGRENPMATHFPSPMASPERPALSTLFEAPLAAIEGGEEGGGQPADEDASMAVDRPAASQASELDIVEELLNTPDSALLADRILARHLISHPAQLKRFDSADAAMEMARRQRQQQLQHPGDMLQPLPPPPGPAAPPAYPVEAFPFSRFTLPPPSPAGPCCSSNDWRNAPLAGSSQCAGLPPRPTPGGMVEFHMEGLSSSSQKEDLMPTTLPPKCERFDSADYWMRAQKIGASADAECQPATAADLRALEQQLLSHHPPGGPCFKPFDRLEHWMEVDQGPKGPEDSLYLGCSPSTTNSSFESDGEHTPGRATQLH